MRRSTTVRLVGLALALGLVAAACGEAAADGVGLYGADGLNDPELNDRVDPDDPNVIDGMTITAPSPSEDEDFLADLQEFAPDLEVTQFAPQAYDCTNLVALAAVAGGDTDSDTIAEWMVPVTAGETECSSFEECAGLLEDGESIAYTGAGGPYEFTVGGEPSRGVYSVSDWTDGELVERESVLSEMIDPDMPDVEAPEPGEPADPEPLDLGYIMPETGDLAFLGPAQIEAVTFAVDRINEAGGIFGEEVTLEGGDEADDAAIASESAERLLGEGVDAIIGAAATGMSLAIIDQVTGAGVVQCSASNTGPVFTDYDHGGYYFRTAPTDALQGPVLAEEILDDGHESLAILARGDEYGEGLLDATAEAFAEAGGDVVEEIIYDPDAATFDAEVEQVEAAGPDAVALVSFEEGVQIIQALIEAGLGPDQPDDD